MAQEIDSAERNLLALQAREEAEKKHIASQWSQMAMALGKSELTILEKVQRLLFQRPWSGSRVERRRISQPCRSMTIEIV